MIYPNVFKNMSQALAKSSNVYYPKWLLVMDQQPSINALNFYVNHLINFIVLLSNPLVSKNNILDSFGNVE